jgi:glutamine amidotransferase
MSPLKIAVIDYESGNLRSVSKALERAGVQPEVTGNPRVLLDAEAAVLPGVGAGDAAMRSLRQRGLVGPVREFVASGKPFLGICLGLQLLMDSTEEGESECLGIIHGRTKRLPEGLKVPHMGWNAVSFRKTHPIFEGIPDTPQLYFVHSYYAQPDDDTLVAGVTEYGIPFCSVLVKDNLVATQFHPEKSSALGLRIYENFVRYAQSP